MKETLYSIVGYTVVTITTLFMLFVVEPYLFSSDNLFLIGLGIVLLISPCVAAILVIYELIKRNKNK